MADKTDPKALDVSPTSPPAKKILRTVETSQKDKAVRSINENRPRLPRLLSPTLPPSIEEQLAKLRGGNAKSTHKASPNTSSVSDKTVHTNGSSLPDSQKPKQSIQKKQDVPGMIEKSSPEVKKPLSNHTAKIKPDSPQVKQVKGGGGSGTKVDANTRQGKGSSVAGNNTPANGPHRETKERPVTAPSSKSNQDSVKKKLVITLKIPKHLRTNCKRILQMQPRPKKFPIHSHHQTSPSPRDPPRERPTPNSNTTHQAPKTRVVSNQDNQKKTEVVSRQQLLANSPATPKSGEKRRKADEEKDLLQPSTKRHKPQATDLTSRPHTPVTSATKSPNLPHHGGSQRIQLSTPKQTLKSAAMNRVGSTDGDVHTPQGPVRGGSTPAAPGSVEAPNREGRSSSNVSATSNPLHTTRSDESLFFKAEFRRYADIARTLKREADPLTKLSDGQYNPDSTVRKQGLAIAIEAMLCFILAFSLSDETTRLMRAPIDRSSWNTLLPYSRFLKSLAAKCQESDHLAGFLCQLEAFCRDTILNHDLDHLERIAGAQDEQRADLATFMTQMSQNGHQTKQSWTQGYSQLDVETLREHYPSTWSKRSETPVGRMGYEKFSSQQNGNTPTRSFYLPLNSASDGLEVAWAGLSFLEEWCSKEGIEWESKIN